MLQETPRPLFEFWFAFSKPTKGDQRFRLKWKRHHESVRLSLLHGMIV